MAATKGDLKASSKDHVCASLLVSFFAEATAVLDSPSDESDPDSPSHRFDDETVCISTSSNVSD